MKNPENLSQNWIYLNAMESKLKRITG